MIQRVYEAAQQAKLLDQVYVATDDERIVTAVEQFGGNVRLTSVDNKTGTDRIAEVATKIDAEIERTGRRAAPGSTCDRCGGPFPAGGAAGFDQHGGDADQDARGHHGPECGEGGVGL